jgi:hypothetical protein
MGVVVQFPRCGAGRFTPEMRSTLAQHAAEAPGTLPLVFGKDGDGAEFCCLPNGLMIGWDCRGRMVLTDTTSGFVDRGPFSSVDEVFLIVAYLTAQAAPPVATQEQA